MTEAMTNDDDLHPLSELDPVIHASARLMVLVHLYVVDSADYVFLKRQTGLSWGNLATHLNKLEEAGYVTIEKGYKGKKPQTMIHLTKHGRAAFKDYKQNLQQVLDDLPD
jgi:DNA-binding MarR family transcriptional regulator